jgi:hypothetical protein
MKLTYFVFSILISVCCTALHAQVDTVTRDVANGDWVYNLHNPDNHNEQYIWRYTPRNKVAPKIKNHVSWNGKEFVYRYEISNSKQAKQALAFVWLRAPFVIERTGELIKPIRTTPRQPENEFMQLYDKYLEAEKALQKKTLLDANNWYSSWNIRQESYTKFGWFPNAMDDANMGVAAGQTVKGFGILRPELPGVMFAETKGVTKDRMILGGLPETGPIAEAVKTMDAEDSVWIPVIVPAIAIPQPYNGAELARRIKAHANYWLKLGLITQDTLDRLNRSFDALIAAQTYNNLAGTHAAVREILQEAYSHHRGLNHTKNEEDDDEHDAEPVKRKAPAAVSLNRVAARALSFDLTYLLTRAHAGK